MAFAPGQGKSAVLSAYTDNLARALKKFGSSGFLLLVIGLELAAQLDVAG